MFFCLITILGDDKNRLLRKNIYIPAPPEPQAPPMAPPSWPNELAATWVGFPSEPTTVISPPKVSLYFCLNWKLISKDQNHDNLCE